MKINNPFTTSGYVSPEYFCNRESESGNIIEAIKSNRNLTLTSLRRMGKTALLRHVEYRLPDKEFEFLYLDLLPTQSSAEFLNILGSALINVKNKQGSFIDKLLKSLSVLRPVISYDSLTGQPAISLTVDNTNEAYNGMRQIFELIGGIKKRIVIVLDEFQQINNYGENNLEALFRSIVQQYPAISFIFSGSNKHMLETMFTSPVRPFFGSADLMNLGTISASDYSLFIKSHFSRGGMQIEQSHIDDILNWCRYHTFYVQYFCNRLYGTAVNAITPELIKKIKIDILESYSPSFNTYAKLLTKPQYDLLKAIAIENAVAQPHSGEFIEKHKLKISSTVKTSLDALASKEMIVYDNNAWQVYDVFLMRWLEYRNSK